MDHEPFIRQVIELAISSGKKGNHTFGALLVHEGQVIASAENTEVSGEGYGHAEYNLVIQSAARIPDRVLGESTLYTSTAPCPRCSWAILAAGIRTIVICVSYDGFAQLLPGPYEDLTIYEIVRRLELPDVEILGPILEDEGMQAFQYWDGEFHPLEKLLEETRRIKEARK